MSTVELEVREDRLEDEELTESGNGIEVTRGFTVTGLPSVDAADVVFHARLAEGRSGKVPRYGQPHPKYAAIQAAQISVKPLGVDSARVVVVYRQLNAFKLNIDDSAPCQVEVGVKIVEVKTQKDRFGNQLSVTHTFNDRDPVTRKLLYPAKDADGNDTTTPLTQTQIGEVTYQLAVPYLVFSRRMSRAQTVEARKYVGALNAGNFMGDPEGAWMCAALTSQSDDGQKSFQVRYEFQFNPDGWPPPYGAVYPDTKELAALNPGEELQFADLYRYEDFGNLKMGIEQ